MLGRTIEAKFAPHEIKTFVLPRGRRRSARDRPARVVSSLGGDDWQLQGWLGEEWRWHVNKPWDAPGWLPARVPGSVLDDLVRADEVPDLWFERNSRLGEWAAERTWIHRRKVAGPGTIRFEGVDHEAIVLRRRRGSRSPRGGLHAIRVRARGGRPLLAVAVRHAPECEPQVGETSRVRVHKSRMGYGWDFCPRLVHQGIWRPVTLDAPPELFPVVTLEDDIGTVSIERDVVLRVDSPELWWPNGMGEQKLYEVEFGGAHFKVGFRERLLRRLRAARQRHRGAGSRLELGPDRRALRRTAAGEARAPARPGRPREREPDPRLGRRADRDAGVLRPLRPARPAGLAGVRPVELGDRLEALGRSGVRRNDDRGRATDRPSPPCAAIARDLVRRQRARRRRLDACARRAAADRARARPRPALAADLAGRRGRTSTARGSIRGCGHTTGTTTGKRRSCTASSASRG